MYIKVQYDVNNIYVSTTESPVYINVGYVVASVAINGVPTGGLEGQVLAKASAADYDTEWIDNYSESLRTICRNSTGSTINAFQVIYISGATGNKPNIVLADADSEVTSSKTFGVTAEAISNNSNGYVVVAGKLTNVDTSAFNAGDALWLSQTAGGVVTTPPAEPAHAVFIGYVVRSHPTLGEVEVKIQNGYELDELHGVQITNPTNGQVLKYDSASGLWINATDAAGTGTVTSITASAPLTGGTITTSGTIGITQASGSADGYLSSGDWTTFNNKQAALTNPITGTGASGQVAYFTGTTSQAGSNNLFWDNTNNNLGVGSNNINSVFKLGISGDVVVSGASPYIAFNTATSSSATPSYIQYTNSSSRLDLYSSGAIDLNNRVRLLSTGNLLLQNGGTFTDGGQRLQVQGDAFIKGSGATSATNALQIQNSAGTGLFNIKNDGSFNLSGGNGLFFSMFTTSGGVASISGTNTQFYNYTTTQAATLGAFLFTGDNFSQTSGNNHAILINKGFAPTSGTSTYSVSTITPTINQTGGANGITRGLYVNPTLTAAADWRSIEWSNNTGWGLYGAGTANNYLAGSLGIGSVPFAGCNFYINKTLTGATGGYSVLQQGTIQSDVTSFAMGFYNQLKTQAAAFTLTNYTHYFAQQSTIGVGSSITNQYGFRVDATFTGATNNYAFYGDIASGTNRWNLYMNGTANNYMAGSLGIGGTSLSNVILSAKKNIEGSTTSYGIIIEGSIRSGVTSQANLFSSAPSIQNSVFTLNTLRHYSVDGITTTNSATITSQMGFQVLSTMTGGTNNYSFYGDLASATGRWNLYMNGTAANYLAGVLNIGTTTLAGYTLDVNGTSRFSNTLLLKQDQDSFTYAQIENATAGTASRAILILQSNSLAGSTSIAKCSSSWTAFKTLAASDAYWYNGTAGDISILNDWASGNIKFSAGASSTAQMVLDYTGALSVGKADVNGKSVISGSGIEIGDGRTGNGYALIDLKGDTTYSDYGLRVLRGNGGANAISEISHRGTGTFSITTAEAAPILFLTGSTEKMRIFANGNVAIGTTTDGGQKFQVNGTGLFSDNLTVSKNQNGQTGINITNLTSGTGAGSFVNINADSSAGLLSLGKYSTTNTPYKIIGIKDGYIYNGTGGDLTLINDFATGKIKFAAGGSSTVQMQLDDAGRFAVGTATHTASAQMQVDSTTRGFLPPRMTETQKNAITTPAAGLMVYDTTNNKLYVYDGTTWQAAW